MRTTCCAALAAAIVSLCAGCPERLDIGVDTGTPDAGDHDLKVVPDTLSPDYGPSTHGIGEGCFEDKDCKTSGDVCLKVLKNASGVCGRKCTRDDPKTKTVNEDTCPKPDTVCGKFDYVGGWTEYHCMKRCTPSLTKNTCPASAKVACLPTSDWLTSSGVAVCMYRGCAANKDCPVLLAKACTADAACKGLAADAYCHKPKKKCARPGSCTAGGLCGPHKLGKAGAKVGDACQTDLDCPSNGFCKQQTTVKGRVAARNGYCQVEGCAHAGLTAFACPSGSTCHRSYRGGLCFKSCKLDDAKTCRGHAKDRGGDYECYGWDRWTTRYGQKLTTTPACEYTYTVACTTMGPSYDCSYAGDASNSTYMSCRDAVSGAKLTNKLDPAGVCLDDTASGPFSAAKDAGP